MTTNLPILFLSDVVPPNYGGVATSCLRIVQYLSTIRDVVVLTPNETDTLKTRNNSIEWPSNVTLYKFKCRKGEARYLEEFARVGEHLCQETDFSLIVGFYLYRAGYIATYLGRRFGIPSLISARGNDVHRSLFHPERHAMVTFAIRNCTIFTAVTHELTEKAGAFSPNIKKKAVVVGNGINFEVGHIQNTENEVGKSKRAVIGFAGDDRKKKGLHILFKALLKVSSDLHSKIELRIAGPISEEKFGNSVLMLRKTMSIIFMGNLPRDKMPAFYNSINILVVPSLHDGLPNVLLEGIVYGSRRNFFVIGSRTGGIQEVLHLFPEFLFHPGDSKELSFILENYLRGTWTTEKKFKEVRQHCHLHYSEAAEKERWIKAVCMAMSRKENG